MEDGLISDTILFYASNFTEGMHKGVFANVMLFVYGGLSFFMPSSSGMAVLTMPIFSPLADTVKMRFVIPLVLVLVLTTMILLTISVYTN